jgi:Cd2+/Zn2+-exporting ATPase
MAGDSGHSAVNQAPVTGESMPVDKTTGDPVSPAPSTTPAPWNYGSRPPPATPRWPGSSMPSSRPRERVRQRSASSIALPRSTRPVVFARWPWRWLLALAGSDWGWTQALYKALVLLVIACPCALVIATPVTVVSGLAAAARRGI